MAWYAMVGLVAFGVIFAATRVIVLAACWLHGQIGDPGQR
jgi:hypothetical protein